MTTFKPGDRIIYTDFGSKPGVIVKPAPRSALVRLDGATKDERVNLDHLRPETAEDVASRQYEQARQAWQASKPKTEHARVTYARFGFNSDESGADVGYVKTPAEMREAAAELLKLADWFAERPVKP